MEALERPPEFVDYADEQWPLVPTGQAATGNTHLSGRRACRLEALVPSRQHGDTGKEKGPVAALPVATIPKLVSFPASSLLMFTYSVFRPGDVP